MASSARGRRTRKSFFFEQGHEADPRHAEILAAGFFGGSRPVTTPGTAAMKSSAEGEKDNEIEDDSPLEGEEVGLFRSYAARANLLGDGSPRLGIPGKGAQPENEGAG